MFEAATIKKQVFKTTRTNTKSIHTNADMDTDTDTDTDMDTDMDTDVYL